MRLERFLFVVMITAGLLQGTGLAAQANSAPQRVPSQSSERSVNDQEKDEVRNEKDQAQSKEAGKNQEGSAVLTRTTTKRRPSASHSTPVPSYRAHPVKTPTANNPGTHAPGSVAALEQTSSKGATSVQNKAVKHHSPSVLPSAVSVDGQQFKNSRDPGARLATSGGPLTAARGTAVINATNMKRKP